MDLSQLESFIEVAKELNFSKAAEKLHITQSTISSRIINLEKEIGINLFHRTGKEVKLSAYGKLLLPFVMKSLDSISEGIKQVESEKKVFEQSLRIGATNPFAARIMPTLLSEINGKFTGLNINLFRPSYSDEVLEMVNQSSIDIGFINHPEKLDDIDCEILYENKVVLVTNSNHPLRKKNEIKICDIADYTFIHLNLRNPISNSVQLFLNKHQFRPRASMEINSVQAIKEVISTSNMITILPELSLIDYIKEGKLSKFSLTPSLPPLLTLLIYSKDYKNKDLIHFVSQKSKSIYENLVASINNEF